ncbi:MAG: hypothetical protein ACK53Y_13975, partial [bacterium]
RCLEICGCLEEYSSLYTRWCINAIERRVAAVSASASPKSTVSQPTTAATGSTTIIPANQTVGAHSKRRANARCE